jgi:hypothetical protein
MDGCLFQMLHRRSARRLVHTSDDDDAVSPELDSRCESMAGVRRVGNLDMVKILERLDKYSPVTRTIIALLLGSVL